MNWNGIFKKDVFLTAGLFCFYFFAAVAVRAESSPEGCGDLSQYRFEHAYLSLAGAGPGLGAGGHAYLLLSEVHGSFERAISYQYNLKSNLDSSTPLSLKSVKAVLRSPFIVSCSPAWSMIERYARENRPQFIFHVAFDGADVRGLGDFLETERSDRDLSASSDYSLVADNCLTKALDALNHFVRDPALKIKSLWRSDLGSFFRSVFSPAEATANVPLLFLATALKHPLLNQVKPLLIRPKSFGVAEMNLSLLAELARIQSVCAWSRQLYATYRSLLVHPKTRETKAFLVSFQQHVDSCLSRQSVAAKRQGLRDNYVNILSSVMANSDSENTRNAVQALIFR